MIDRLLEIKIYGFEVKVQDISHLSREILILANATHACNADAKRVETREKGVIQRIKIIHTALSTLR